MAHCLTVFNTDWGWVGMAISDDGLAGLILPQLTRDDALQELDEHWPRGEKVEAGAFDDLVEEIRHYLAGELIEFSITLDWSGHSRFQQQVWRATCSIPYGETRSYAEVAEAADRPGAYRAVGRAMALNPIPLVVPCHRVVRSDGGLGGYAGGLGMKQRLLEMERRAAAGDSGRRVDG